MALSLSSDLNLNPGPINKYHRRNHTFNVFNSKGPDFLHLNITGLLPKMDQLRYIAKSSNAAVIGFQKLN